MAVMSFAPAALARTASPILSTCQYCRWWVAHLRLAELLWRKQSEDPAITGCHRNAAFREHFKALARLARAEGWILHGNKGRKPRQPAKGTPPAPSTPQVDTISLLELENRIKALMARKVVTKSS
jgi:hypothetical protein